MTNMPLNKMEKLSLRLTELRLHDNIAWSQAELYLVKAQHHTDTSSELYMKDFRNHVKWKAKWRKVNTKLLQVQRQIDEYKVKTSK